MFDGYQLSRYSILQLCSDQEITIKSYSHLKSLEHRP